MKGKHCNGFLVVRVCILLLLCSSLSMVAKAEEKRALVIGNGQYHHINRLKNPVNDARTMTQTLRLRSLGFKVTELHNRSRKQMAKAISTFGNSINPSSVALIYFAGHGAQFKGENYLFPVDFNTQEAKELPIEAISTSFIMDNLGRNANGLNILILDACRDNPLQSDGRSYGARGLARIANAPPNTYNIFATAPGRIASDNTRGGNGLFTKYLVQYMKQPGLNLSDMVIETRNKVMQASGNKQIPYDYGTLTRRYCLAGCEVNTVAAASTQAPKPKPTTVAINPNQHSHNGRSHTHPLPASGKNHQHGGATRPTTPAVVRPSPRPVGTRDYREPEMKLIRGGTFTMGSPASEKGRDDEKPHSVRVGDFYLGKTEVTVGEFKRFVQARGYRTTAETNGKGCRFHNGSEWADGVDKNWKRPGFSQTDQHPVVCVSFDDAMAYSQWLSSVTGKRYGLPTEAQWEYAVRARTKTARYWGNDIGNNQANCDGCGSQWDNKGTAPVGRFRANVLGLNDMLGNVWEWTCSAYDKNYAGGKEQRCVGSGSRAQRALRGGSWYSEPRSVRSAYRVRNAPTARYYFVGFRLSRTP